MSQNKFVRRLIRTVLGAVFLCLLLGTTEANAPSKRVDAAQFFDPTLPDCGLQKAIDSVPEGGLLIIPKGTYRLRRSLVLKAHMTFSGTGPDTVLTVMPLPPCTQLAARAEKGDKSVRVADGSRFQPGMQVAVRDSDHVGWGTSHAVITAVKDNVLELDRPLERSYLPDRQAYVGHLFPALYAKEQPGITIQFLKITGPKVPTPFKDFVLSAIHLVKCDNSLVTNCTIEEWHSDGFSVQRGSGVRVMDNVARRNRGHGFHPGTGLTDSFWSGNLGEQNGDFGLYYCASAGTSSPATISSGGTPDTVSAVWATPAIPTTSSSTTIWNATGRRESTSAGTGGSRPERRRGKQISSSAIGALTTARPLCCSNLQP